MRKKLMLVLVFISVTTSLCFAEWVNGYTRRNGTYVNGYNRSDSNGTVQDNYSYKGNVNPYTGVVGSNYYRNDSSSQYYNPSQSTNYSSYSSILSNLTNRRRQWEQENSQEE